MNQPTFSHPLKAYTRASHTVAKTRQVVMLYDGAIRFLKQALEAIEQGQIEQRYLKLTRASDILIGLQSALDFDSGQETAQLLYNFYASLDARIISLHLHPQKERCEEVIRDLKAMRDVWDEIDRGGKGGAVPPVAVEQPAAAQASPAADFSQGITFSA